jgi:adenylate kinase
VIKNRLAQYREKTEPLIDHYEERGILHRVEGEHPPDEVEERIHALLATLRREEEMEI